MVDPVVIEQWMSSAESAATILALGVGAWWTYSRFISERGGVPRIQFDVEVRDHGVVGQERLVELVAIVENKGRVQHVIKDFRYGVRYLLDGEPFEVSAEIADQVRFPNIAREGSWVPPAWEYTFVEPEVSNTYSVLTSVPTASRFLLLWARFDYNRPYRKQRVSYRAGGDRTAITSFVTTFSV